MNQHDFAISTGVRVRIDVARFAMSGPASVPDSRSSVDWLTLADLGQLRNATCFLANSDLPTVLKSDSGAVVSSVLESE